MKNANPSPILPPLPSRRRVIRERRKCALQIALERKLTRDQTLSVKRSSVMDNSVKWFDVPPETIGEKIAFMRKLGTPPQWIRNLKA